MSVAGLVGVGPAQVQGVQDLVATRQGKFVTSVVVVSLFALFTAGLRAIGPRLKAEYTADDVEAVQAVVFTVFAAATSWTLVVVWRAVGEVTESLSFAQIGLREGALALVCVFTLLIAYTVTRIIKGLLDRGSGDVITAHRREAIHHILQLVIYTAAVVFILSLGGVNPADLIVGAGVIGLVVGLAARQTLGAVLAGLVLLFARPFELGDWIVIEERAGIVTDITLFNTELRTKDNEHVMIPNDEVTASEIVNRSRSGRLRVSVEVGIDYDADVTHAAEVAERAMAECNVGPLLGSPSPSVVGKRFGDSAIVLECRFWISDPNARRKWRAQSAIIRAIKTAFDEDEIKIPYPQRELVARNGTDGFRLAGEEFGPPVEAAEERSDD